MAAEEVLPGVSRPYDPLSVEGHHVGAFGSSLKNETRWLAPVTM